MGWFKREKKPIEQPTPPDERRVKTEGLWIKCEAWRAIVWKKDLEANWNVCPKCQFHFKLNAAKRLELLLDGQWTEHDASMISTDPLDFTDTRAYKERIKEAKKKLGMSDAILCVEGKMNGRGVVCCSMEFAFIGGWMGAVGGGKGARAVRPAPGSRPPPGVVSLPGGARPREGAHR